MARTAIGNIFGGSIDSSEITDGAIMNVDINSSAAIDPSKIGAGAFSGAMEAIDHGTAATDQIINVCYGTSATPPTASTTTEGTLYVQYTA